MALFIVSEICILFSREAAEGEKKTRRWFTVSPPPTCIGISGLIDFTVPENPSIECKLQYFVGTFTAAFEHIIVDFRGDLWLERLSDKAIQW